MFLVYLLKLAWVVSRYVLCIYFSESCKGLIWNYIFLKAHVSQLSWSSLIICCYEILLFQTVIINYNIWILCYFVILSVYGLNVSFEHKLVSYFSSKVIGNKLLPKHAPLDSGVFMKFTKRIFVFLLLWFNFWNVKSKAK